jgi:YHS domain-containing protein
MRRFTILPHIPTIGDNLGQLQYKGQSYYFCSLGCKKSFDKEPEKYVSQVGDEETHHHS